MHDDETWRHARSLIQGAARGLALGLGMSLAMDAAAAGEVTGWWRLDLPHAEFLPGAIVTLTLAAALLELERLRLRLARHRL